MDSERRQVQVIGTVACALLLLWAAMAYRSWVIRTTPVKFHNRTVRNNAVTLAVHGDSAIAIRALAEEMQRSPKAMEIKVRLIDLKCFLIYSRKTKDFEGSLRYWPDLSGAPACTPGSGYSIYPMTDELIYKVSRSGGGWNNFADYGAYPSHDNIATC